MSIREALKPKSDQLNADDLIGNITKIIKITGVKINLNSDQPIIIDYEGGQGRPWKPCKSMGRVLAALWGDDELLYIGRYVELYRDANVRWAGEAVGGIRIKSLSDIVKREVLSITISRNKKERITIEPLQIKQEIPIEERVKKAINVLHGDNVNDKIINAASSLLGKLDTNSDLHYELTQALTLHTQLAEAQPEQDSNSEQPAFIVDDNPFNKGE